MDRLGPDSNTKFHPYEANVTFVGVVIGTLDPPHVKKFSIPSFDADKLVIFESLLETTSSPHKLSVDVLVFYSEKMKILRTCLTLAENFQMISLFLSKELPVPVPDISPESKNLLASPKLLNISNP